jgi:hypothetical protein
MLILGGDLERESLVMFERGTSVEADAGDASNRKFDCQHITYLTGWVVTRRTVHSAHHAVGKGLCVKTGSRLGVLIVLATNRVLRHYQTFRFEAKSRFGTEAQL